MLPSGIIFQNYKNSLISNKKNDKNLYRNQTF